MKQTLGTRALALLASLVASLHAGAAGAACPTDATPRAATVLLTLTVPGQPPLSLGAAEQHEVGCPLPAAVVASME